MDSVKNAWKTLVKHAGLQDARQYDLREFLNTILVMKYGLSHTQAGYLIGNSAEVNKEHYTFLHSFMIRDKLSEHSLSEMMNITPRMN